MKNEYIIRRYKNFIHYFNVGTIGLYLLSTLFHSFMNDTRHHP